MQGGHPFEGGEGLNGFSGFLLGDTQVIQALQVDPEFGAGAEEMSQAQRRVRRDVAAAAENSCVTVTTVSAIFPAKCGLSTVAL